MKRIIHVAQDAIRANTKDGGNRPAIIVRCGSKPERHNEVEITGPDGSVVARFVYSHTNRCRAAHGCGSNCRRAPMRVPCEACEGFGNVISVRSVRQGHTHSNDPDREDELCDACDGDSDREAEASDLDGQRVRYRYVTGYVSYERKNNTLTLVCENHEFEVVNLQPEHLMVLNEVHGRV